MAKKARPEAPGTTGAQVRGHYYQWCVDEGFEPETSDEALLDRLAQAVDTARELDQRIATEGVVITHGPTGTAKANPLLSVRRAEAEQIAKLTVLLDKRWHERAAGTDAADRPAQRGVQPYSTRGSYGPRGATGTDNVTPMRREHHSRAGGRRPGNSRGQR